MKTLLTRSMAVLALSSATLVAHSTVLTFGDLPLTANIPQEYGDFVTGVGGGTTGSYEMGSGWTPNVEVSYLTVDGSGVEVSSSVAIWGTGYGDLENNIYPVFSGSYGRVTFTPNPGMLVTIESFDMGSWLGDITPDRLQLMDSGGNILWSDTSVQAPPTGRVSFMPMITHDGAVTLEFGENWNMGIDNISFSESVVPEPASVAILSLGVAALARRRRRRSSR